MKITAEQVKEVIPTEEALCRAFIAEFNEQPGWVCYPETGGFDILVVHESGTQIGVQAKLQLNAKVADQILPSKQEYLLKEEGPDHRLVIVRSLSEANEGIARLLQEMGIPVWSARVSQEYTGSGMEIKTRLSPCFDIGRRLREEDSIAKDDSWHRVFRSEAIFDWNPVKRIALPPAVPSCRAGIPSPVQVTPWKVAALRVLARLRIQGFITAKEIAEEGCSPSMWTQRWLGRGAKRGQWVETESLPKFDQQHPEIYAAALAAARDKWQSGQSGLLGKESFEVTTE